MAFVPGARTMAIFRQHHVLGTRARLAFELLLNTVQRRGDVIRMGPQHVKNGLLNVRQTKTREHLALPILSELQAALDATANDHLTFLTTANGKPFTPAGFGNWFRQVCDEAGLHGFSAHGLRKAGCRRLAEAGCSASEIAAWSGHRTLSEVARYTRAADQAAMARAAAIKLGTSLSKQSGPNCQTTGKNQRKQVAEE
jgi:integrase